MDDDGAVFDIMFYSILKRYREWKLTESVSLSFCTIAWNRASQQHGESLIDHSSSLCSEDNKKSFGVSYNSLIYATTNLRIRCPI